VLDQAEAKTPFQQMFLLVGALDKIAAGASESWSSFARDMAAHLLLAPPLALAGGAEPGPAHAETRAMITLDVPVTLRDGYRGTVTGAFVGGAADGSPIRLFSYAGCGVKSSGMPRLCGLA